MTIRPTLWAAILIGLGLSSGLRAGDMVLSQSNSPKVSVSGDVAAMLQTEREALAALRGDKVRSLVTQPTRRNLWFKTPEVVAQPEFEVARLNSDFLAELPAPSGGKSWECLTQALYFEARGESVKGMFAVGEVILNRVESRAYPNDVCGVVNQGTGELYRCQFTYMCDGRAEVIDEPAAWRKVGKVAKLLLSGEVPRNLTDGATHYHTKAVAPRWSKVFTRTATIGYHYFYREEGRYASN